MSTNQLEQTKYLNSNKLEHWYIRHNNVYCLHLWAVLPTDVNNKVVVPDIPVF